MVRGNDGDNASIGEKAAIPGCAGETVARCSGSPPDGLWRQAVQVISVRSASPK
ncbi:hypothetical protein CLV71_11675 [Actinophytocola oryzae]|uniref:Uncharacterized protein n=1 Tax=Actinophytocola oryzae TaxID=502181 RepID=A0A4V6Q6L3_9PSEU|nr:hypothetical protein CLV71_11675 [Actinophytocola oryzae]